MTDLYLTPGELSSAPTGIAWTALFPSQPVAGQAWYCRMASALIDNICGREVYGTAKPYVLRATTDTETGVTTDRTKALVDVHGNLDFMVTLRPIISVNSVRYVDLAGAGMTGTASATTANPNDVSWEGRQVRALGAFDLYRVIPARVDVTYVNGFANCLLSENAAQGATSLSVDDATGVQAGQELTVYDMPGETVQIAGSYAGGATLPLTAGLATAHASGTRVSALTPDLQQAALWLITDLVQSRGQQGVAMARKQIGTGAVPEGTTDFHAKAVGLIEDGGYVLTP